MRSLSAIVLGTGGLLAVSVTLFAQSGPVIGPPDEELTQTQRIQRFLDQNEKSTLHWTEGRITRVYGAAFSSGGTAEQSAGRFLQSHAGMLGIQPADLVPPAGEATVPLMFDAAAGAHRFTQLRYVQVRDGVPVFRSGLSLLVRNEPGYPLVLAATDVRDIGDFAVPAAGGPSLDENQVRGVLTPLFGQEPVLNDLQAVIWAGVENGLAQPRLAVSVIGIVGEPADGDDYQKRLFVLDGQTGEVLYEEDQIIEVDVTGSVRGMATDGTGADFCNPEVSTPMPYARVNINGNVEYANAQGNFTLFNLGSVDVTVESRVWGQYFRVFNTAGADALLSEVVTPPGPVHFLHNASNASELTRAEVNAYVQSNVVRDFVLSYVPNYPVINNQTEFAVNVNINDNCNAFYDGSSINFFTSGGGCPNTAYDTVVYHEYGHHLVSVAGSGQGAYGEGMGDVIGVIITDQSVLGAGWSGSCSSGLRNADNTCQYSASNCSSCGSAIHACGMLLSGSIWDLRNELLSTDPLTYRDTLSSLTFNSILLHTGSSIDGNIPIDFLTLDDDNGNILDGTPHYQEIYNAFTAHGLPVPDLALIGFNFPLGLPDLLAPSGGTTVRVEVEGVTGVPEPGTGLLHVSTTGPSGGFIEMPMVEVEANVYDATFPAFDCGSSVYYYFSAESTGGFTETWPGDAPISSEQAVAATSSTEMFADDFQTNQGWTIQNTALDGQWTRGTPAGGGVRGDPAADGDGSGQCYLTDNVAGNSDVDDGSTTLTSPPMDASQGASYISYMRWYSNDFGSSPFQDIFTVQVSDDGASWITLETVGPGGAEVSGGWFYRQFSLADVPGLTLNDQFQIRFIASDTDPQSVVEVAVDGVTLRVYECDDPGDPCPADCTGDSIVDVDDLTQIILGWGPAEPGACDPNGDGVINVDDLTDLITSWGACP